jgi:hypothetical protein
LIFIFELYKRLGFKRVANDLKKIKKIIVFIWFLKMNVVFLKNQYEGL